MKLEESMHLPLFINMKPSLSLPFQNFLDVYRPPKSAVLSLHPHPIKTQV